MSPIRRIAPAVIALVLASCQEAPRVTVLECTPVAGSTVLAQDVRIIEADRACSIAIDPDAVELTWPAESNADFLPPLIVLPNGELLSRSSMRDQINRWEATGEYLGSFGRRGKGPGEFNAVGALFMDQSDTIHVADLPGRWQVLDADLRHVRTNLFLINEWTDVAFLDDGRVLAGRNSGFPPGTLFHLVDRTGRITKSFGVAAHPDDTRRIAYRGGDTFWAVSPSSYTIEAWTISGQHLGSITRVAEWFPPSAHGEVWNWAEPRPYILRLLLDDEHRLWCVIFLPSPNGSSDDLRTAGDWMVEVFSTHDGALLASVRYDSPGDGVPAGILDDGRMYQSVELEDGLFSARIARFRLVSGSTDGDQ